ncbi:hypothetical protein F4804DRAFT_174721 [Jackrogersella minutella]|nr:hypothetical protein F4804DRAFT_174721 [Jackrogersella minutella]
MRFTYFITAFLATLAIASPISSDTDIAEGVNLVTRDTVTQTPEYKAAAAAHSGLQKDKYYYFLLKWELPAKIADGDTETLSELQQLQKNLGFEHIGVVVGQVTETTKGKTGKKQTTQDFKAFLYHMTKDKDNNVMGHSPTYKYDGKPLEYGGTTSKKAVDKAKTNAKDYVADKDHKAYNVDNNNCNTYAQAVLQAFK